MMPLRGPPMIATRLPPADFLRLLADRLERGEDCRGYSAGLRTTADLVEQHSHEWHAVPAPVLQPLAELLERRRGNHTGVSMSCGCCIFTWKVGANYYD
jgi:hypothetical protein